MNFLIHDRLLAFLAGVLVISTVAVWKTGTSHYSTIILHPEFWCLFFSLIWLLYFIFIFPCIFFLNLNPRLISPFFLEKRWLSKSSARKVDMLHNNWTMGHVFIILRKPFCNMFSLTLHALIEYILFVHKRIGRMRTLIMI